MRAGSTYFPSIINTILGPITIGPSSSHLAGPVNIGLLAKSLFSFEPQKIEIIFNAAGSFAGTYKGHKTDCALVAGLLGYKPQNLAIPTSLEKAKELGLEVEVKVEPFKGGHPNQVLLKGKAENKTSSVLGVSQGGGSIEILAIDDYPTAIDGYNKALFIVLDHEDDLNPLLAKIKELRPHCNLINQDRLALTFTVNNLLTVEEIAALKKEFKLKIIKQSDAVFTPPTEKASAKPLFQSAAELLAIAQEKEITLAEVALIYEQEKLGIDSLMVYNHLDEIIEVMKQSLQRGLQEELQFSGGISKQGGKKFFQHLQQKKTLSQGTISKGAAYALAVNEVSASLGLIVAAPTAGASGVIIGALAATLEDRGLADNQQAYRQALLTAGAIGSVFAQRATFLAELCGCQVETGIAAAMAAAALVELATGSADEAINAAAIALQNIMGMECDPVGGLMEVPCLSRNALGACNAILSAELALLGIKSIVPFDEVTDAVYECGLSRPNQCSGLSGLAITPTGKKIKKMYES